MQGGWPLKFVLLCRTFDFSHRDAVTVEATQTAKALTNSGHEVAVVTGHSDLQDFANSPFSIQIVPDKEIIHPFKYHALLKTIKRIEPDRLVNYLSFMLLPKLSRVLENLRVSAYHRMIHGKLLSNSYHGLIDLFLKYPVVYKSVDLYDLMRLFYPGFTFNLLDKDALGTVITLSELSGAWFRNAGFENVVAVPPGVESVWYDPVDAADLGGNSKRIIYFGGGPVIFRGVDILIDALSVLNDPTVYLDILLRSTQERDEIFLLDKIRNLSLSSHIHLVTGFQSRSFLLNEVNQAVVAVFPYKLMARVADVPLAILEAMASGRPVISTRAGAIPEIIQQNTNGLLVEPSSVKELVEALRTLLANPDRWKSLSSNARKSAAPYKSDLILTKLVALYSRS